ncbi:hypothetical protein ABK040_001790 [Willaertia magna]
MENELDELYAKFLKSKEHEVTIEELLENDEQTKKDNGIWLFGYGSLIWKPEILNIDQFGGYVVGYRRRFWQMSRDHRGTFEYPGRVLTCLTEEDYEKVISNYDEESPLRKEEKEFQSNEVLYGMCYLIPKDQALEIFKQLDYREKGGYHRTIVTVHSSEKGHSKRAILYVGSINNFENTEFVSPSSLGCIEEAKIIAKAIGPSGKNKDYLFQLTKALRERFGGTEPYLYRLEENVKKLLLE